MRISAPVEASVEPSEVDGDHENVGVWLDGLPVIGYVAMMLPRRGVVAVVGSAMKRESQNWMSLISIDLVF